MCSGWGGGSRPKSRSDHRNSFSRTVSFDSYTAERVTPKIMGRPPLRAGSESEGKNGKATRDTIRSALSESSWMQCHESRRLVARSRFHRIDSGDMAFL
jgi:hypothetical protein